MKASDVSRILAAVTNGVPKTFSPVPMTPEMSVMWDKLVAEVSEAKSKGYIIDVPSEAPDVQVPAPDKSVKKSIARDEVKTFIKFIGKSPNRPFEFVHVDEIYGEVLNKFVKAGDLDSARMYAERYLA